MAIKKEDVTPGKRFRTIFNPKVNRNTMDIGIPELQVYGSPGGALSGSGNLPIGTEVEVVVAPRKVPGTSMAVDIKIVSDPSEKVYSCFWTWFKMRVEAI